MNAAHVLGAALLVGGIAVFDVMVLARGRGAAAVDAAGVAISVAAAGLALQVATGIFLLSADARSVGVNPAFAAKAGFIALGILNLVVLHVQFGPPWRGGFEAARARPYALASIAAWTGALVAGRLIAYV